MAKVDVSNFLKKAISKSGISRHEWAKNLGLKYGSLTAIIIRGRIPPGKRAKFAEELKVTVQYINQLHGDQELIHFVRAYNLMPLIKNLILANVEKLSTTELNTLIKVQKSLDDPLSHELIKDILTIK